MIEFKLSENEEMDLLCINMHDTYLYIDPSFIKYVYGRLNFVKSLTKKQTILKYYKHGARSLIPKIEGTGEIHLKPILGNFNTLDLNLKENHNLICNKDAFVAGDPDVELTPQLDISLSKLFSSLPIRNYLLVGTGKAILYSNGPLTAIDLNNEKFSLYSGQVIAYSSTLNVTENISNDGHWGLSKKNKTILDFFGTGTIYLVSHPNKLYLLANKANKPTNQKQIFLS